MKGTKIFNTRILQKLGASLLVIVCFHFTFYAEAGVSVQGHQACKAKYKGDIGELNGKTVIVDQRMVAMSSEIKVKKPPITVITKVAPASIFFIIDNSGSMGAQGQGAQDAAGSRFRVTHDFIDTIKAKFDSVAEVGVAIFGKFLCYNPVDNPLFKKVPAYDTGAYLPLLGLNMSYPPSGTTGYDILRFYLDTTVKTQGGNTYVDLKYTPTQPFPVGQQNQSTCINAGFDAAKDAFSICTRPKERQFIIFLSDGEANQTNGTDAVNKYVTGAGTPTTFTVFFTRNTTPPAQLVTMTNNIKANQYSSKNPSSSIWAIQTDYPTLMKLLIDSVLNNIISTITNHPDSIVINGNQSLVWDSVNNMFNLNSLFPLRGVNTDFNYRIKYTIFKQKIVGNDTQIVPVDSIAEGKYTITIQQGAVTPDTFEVTCWTRDQGFYYNNAKITTANETMKNLEFRFYYDQGLAKYNYTKAVIEITTQGSGGTGDKEIFSLIKNGTVFSCVFPIEVNPTPTTDGKLQVQFVDKIYAVFRNAEDPKLPLDTLKDTIDFKIKGTLSVTGAYYYDNTGDGFIDSIYVTLDSAITAEQVLEIKDSGLITIPDERKFTVSEYKYLNSNSFAIRVSQDKAQLGEPTTYRESYDILKTKWHIFTTGGWLYERTIDIQDRVAPIIMSARAKVVYTTNPGEVVKDTFWVNFSETINPITAPDPFQPFYFIRHDGSTVTTFVPTLLRGNATSPANQMRFTVDNFNNPGITHFIRTDLAAGKTDSLWITWTYNYVGDTVGSSNFQRHEFNTRRLLNTETVIPNVDLQIISTNPFIINNTNTNINGTIPINIINILDPVNVQEIKKLNNQGIVIQILPDTSKLAVIDSLKGTLNIYDALGNLLMKNRTMGYNKVNKTLNFVWTGKNTKGRNVGGGTYLAIAKTTSYIKDDNGPKTRIFKVFLGIKQQ